MQYFIDIKVEASLGRKKIKPSRPISPQSFIFVLTHGLHARYFIAPLPKKAYAFGSGVKERTASFIKKYRFGFNGKEDDKVTKADEYDFVARIFDARLGTWLDI